MTLGHFKFQSTDVGWMYVSHTLVKNVDVLSIYSRAFEDLVHVGLSISYTD